MPPTMKISKAPSMTYVENMSMAEILFGAPVLPPDEFRAIAQATPFLPDFKRLEKWAIDTSVYNGTADAWKIKAFYRAIAEYNNYLKLWITRAGQSWGYEDPTLEYNWICANLVGIPKQAYWVIFPSQPVDAQIHKLMQTFEKMDLGFGDGPLWIDFELHHNMEAKAIQAALWDFYTKLKSETGHPIGVYTGKWFTDAFCTPAEDWWAEIEHLWLAHYFSPDAGREITFMPDKPDKVTDDQVDLHQNQSHYDFIELGFLGDGILRGDGNRYIHPSRPFSKFVNSEDGMTTGFRAFMREDNNYSEVTDRFSLLEGSVEDGVLNFHFTTLADKMSAQEGRLYIIPDDMPDVDYAEPQGVINVASPRKPDFPHRSGVVVWAYGPGSVPSLIFTVEDEAMTGSRETSDDVPWNWHYGFDITGSIVVPSGTTPPDPPEPPDPPDPGGPTDAQLGASWRMLEDYKKR